MQQILIGKRSDSEPSSEQVALLGKLNIDPSAVTLDKPSSVDSWRRLAVPDISDFTLERTRGEISTTTIYYQGVSVISVKEKDIRHENWFHFNVNRENILQLEKEGRLPEPDENIQKNVLEYTQKLDIENQYSSLKSEFADVCSQYMDRLRLYLQHYKIRENSYMAPSAEYPLDLLAYKKFYIVMAAQQELLNNNRSSSENMKACLDKLQKPENVAILVQRRDSWLMAGAKVIGTLGLVLIYRALMGEDEATHGMQNLKFFRDEYKKLKDSERDAPTANSKIASSLSCKRWVTS